MNNVIQFTTSREPACSHGQLDDGGDAARVKAIHRAQTLMDIGKRLTGPLAALQPKLYAIRVAIQSLDDPQAGTLEATADSLKERTPAAIDKPNEATEVLMRAHAALVLVTDG
jgi:hypothetical protein